MKCPVCAMAELVNELRDLPYTYKNESPSNSLEEDSSLYNYCDR
jgi:hypothetical protein